MAKRAVWIARHCTISIIMSVVLSLHVLFEVCQKHAATAKDMPENKIDVSTYLGFSTFHLIVRNISNDLRNQVHIFLCDEVKSTFMMATTAHES